MDWISQTVNHCLGHPGNDYFFQSKNPKRMSSVFAEYASSDLSRFIFATTLESNRWFKEMRDAPRPIERIKYMRDFRAEGRKTVVTIEPIMDFDLYIFLKISYDKDQI